MIRAGLIINPKSHRNRRGGTPWDAAAEGLLTAAPRTRAALDEALAGFAQAGIELLVIDGGDGTLREVLTRAPEHFPRGLPRLAALPSGKTNALAIDLGAPPGWTWRDALRSAARGEVRLRRPLELVRAGAALPFARGFLFGAGAFVRATELSRRAHRLGVFHNAAVAMTLAAAAWRTLFGPADGAWRAGEIMRLRFDDGPAEERQLFLLLASTLERLPLSLRPFGAPSPQLKTLTVDAPPKRLAASLPVLLAGREPPWLDRLGYRRRRPQNIELSLRSGFVLDGEIFEGGDLVVRMGAPLEFVAP